MQAIRNAHAWRIRFITSMLAIAVGVASPLQDPAFGQDASQILARYLKVVLRNPRYGTAFQRVYDAHLANQSLETLLQELDEEFEATQSPNPLIVKGMVYFRNGKFEKAIVSFDAAIGRDPGIAHCYAYKARAQKQSGASEQAVDSFRQALANMPDKQLLIEVSTELAELLGQLRRADEALAVWEILESEFPGDIPILEQIAFRLSQLGELDEAQKRYARLSKSKSPSLKKIEWAFRSAEINLKRGESAAALAEFERLAARVNPQSWLFQTIRDAIDRVFLATRDYQGLIAYYRKWQSSHPEDVDALIRCGKLLSIHGEREEAIAILRKAIDLVPSDPVPRVELIGVLERDAMVTEAVKEFSALLELEPGNLDHLERWGSLVLKSQKPLEERQAEAAAIWERMLPEHSDNPVIVVRVADLLRQVEQTERALELYRDAIRLAESEPQYREYLGEYLFTLDRKQEAIEVWKGIASEARASLANWVRLSEVFSAFELAEQALNAMREACDLNPTPMHRLRYAKLLRESEEFEGAVEQVLLAVAAAEEQETLQAAWEAEIECYLAMGSLEEKIREAEQMSDASSTAWHRLALMYAANTQLGKACDAIENALRFSPDSIDILLTGSSLNERAGNTRRTLGMLQELSRLDRPSRANYIPKIASLQMQIGQLQEALETAKELINVDSASPEQYFRYADLCDRAGKPEEAMQALRQNVYANPREFDAVHRLASRLFASLKLESAEQLAWQAFELACDEGVEQLDLQESALNLLTRILLITGGFDELDQKLVLIGRENGWTTHTALLRSIAFSQAGFFGDARRILNEVNDSASPDLDILERLRKLALVEYDYASAIEIQQTINNLFASQEANLQLARLYADLGDFTKAAQLLGEEAREEVLKSLLALAEQAITRNEQVAAKELLDKAENLFPDSWEVLSVRLKLETTSLMSGGKETARRIVALRIPEDKPRAAQQLAFANRSLGLANRRSVNYARMNSFMNYLERAKGSTGFAATSVNLSRLWPGIGSANDLRDIALMLLRDESYHRQRVDQAIKEQDRRLLWDAFFSNYSKEQTQRISGSTIGGSFSFNVPNLVSDLQKKILFALIDLGDEDAVEMYLSQRYSERQMILVSGSRISSTSTQPSIAALGADEINKIVDLLGSLPSSRPRANYMAWAMRECELAGVGSDKLLKIHANDNTSAAAWLSLVPIFSQAYSPTARFVVENVIRRAREENVGLERLNYLDYYVAGLLKTKAGASSQREAAVEFLRDVLSLQAHQVERASPKLLAYTGTGTPVQIRSTQVVSSLGSRTTSRNQVADFPLPNAILSQPVIQSLFRCHLHSDKQLHEQVRSLLQEVVEQKVSPAQELVALAALSGWDWWKNDRPAAIKSLERAYSLQLGQEQVATQLAALYSKEGRHSDALELLDGIEPSNSTASLALERFRLSVAEKTDDSELIKSIAMRLFAIANDATIEAQLLKTANKLDFEELEDLIKSRQVTRMRRSLGSDVALLDHFVASRQEGPALAIAESILRKSKLQNLDVLMSFPTNSRNSAAYFQTRSSRSSPSPRSKALDYLKRKGKLPGMIRAAEEGYKLAGDLNSARRLIELYVASGRKADATRIALEAAPENSQLRQRLNSTSLRDLLANGRKAEALAILKPILEKNPAYFSQPANAGLISLLTKSQSWGELAELLLETEAMGKIQDPAFVTNLVQGLSSKNERDLLIKVIVVQFESVGFELFRTQILSTHLYDGFGTDFHGERDSPSEIKFRELFVARILADGGQEFRDWEFDRARSSRAAAGKFSLVWRVLRGTKQLEHLVSGLQEAGENRSGVEQLLLSYLLAKSGRQVAKAERLLESIVNASDAMRDYRLAWEACQAVSERRPESPTVLTLVERIVKLRPHWTMAFELGPQNLLFERWVNAGNDTEASILIENWVQVELSLLRSLPTNLQAPQRAQKYVEVAAAYDRVGRHEDCLLWLSKAVDEYAGSSASIRGNVRGELRRANSLSCVKDRDLRMKLLLEAARNPSSKLHGLATTSTRSKREAVEVRSSFHDLASYVEVDKESASELLKGADDLPMRSHFALFSLARLTGAEDQQLALARLLLRDFRGAAGSENTPKNKLPLELVFVSEHLPRSEAGNLLRTDVLRRIRNYDTSVLGTLYGVNSSLRIVQGCLEQGDEAGARAELANYLAEFGHLSYQQRFSSVWEAYALCEKLGDSTLALEALRIGLAVRDEESKSWEENGFLPISYGDPSRRVGTSKVDADYKASQLVKRLSGASESFREHAVEPTEVFATFFELVFSADSSEIRPLYGPSKSTTATFSTLHQDPIPRMQRYSLLSDLISWSVAAGESHRVVGELTRRQVESNRNADDAQLISIAETAIALEKKDFGLGNTKLQALLTLENMSSSDTWKQLSLVFNRWKAGLAPECDLDLLAALPISKLRLSGDLQHLVVLKLHTAVRDGDNEDAIRAIELMEKIHAYREVSRKQRLQSIYSSVVRLAKSHKNKELEEHYAAMLGE